MMHLWTFSEQLPFVKCRALGRPPIVPQRIELRRSRIVLIRLSFELLVLIRLATLPKDI